MQKSKAKVIIHQSIKPPPAAHEKRAAGILAQHFNCSIVFLQPEPGYKRKTPDFIMKGKVWELKSPISNKSHKLEDNLKQATRQAANIIFDSSRTKLSDQRIQPILIRNLKLTATIKQIVWLKKDKTVVKVIDIKKK